MGYSRIQEEARVSELGLKRANDAARNALYTMEDAAVGGYKAIEHAVVGGYKKIEHAFVSGWEKVEETCVGALFTKEGETAQEAVARLQAEAAEHRGEDPEVKP